MSLCFIFIPPRRHLNIRLTSKTIGGRYCTGRFGMKTVHCSACQYWQSCVYCSVLTSSVCHYWSVTNILCSHWCLLSLKLREYSVLLLHVEEFHWYLKISGYLWDQQIQKYHLLANRISGKARLHSCKIPWIFVCWRFQRPSGDLWPWQW